MEKRQAIEEAINIIVPNINEIFKQRINKGSKIQLNNFLEVISKEKYNLVKDLNSSNQSISNLLSALFPNRKKSTNRICGYILSLVDLKWCGHCKKVWPYDNFSKNSAHSNGLNNYCKKCHLETTKSTQNYRQAKYRSSKIERTPKWADLEKIKEIYNNCPEGYHVDHIIPLQGEKVSGLHVENNLQYLSPSENLSKSNKCWIG